jgi:hypothetical protein
MVIHVLLSHPKIAFSCRHPSTGEPLLMDYGSPVARGDQAPRSWRGNACRDWPQLQLERVDDFKVDGVIEKGICDEQVAL